jgi:uncharacterized membrane protein YeaQ/YmgE (transglycosylase-associated protein family)
MGSVWCGPDAAGRRGATMLGFLWFLLIGLVAGYLAGQIVKGRSFGVAGDLVVGVAGAFVGGLLFRVLGLSASNAIGSLITATAGAVVFLWGLRMIRRA